MKIINVAVAVVGIGLLFGACSRATISPNWGVAYQEMRAKQVLDPTPVNNWTLSKGRTAK